MGELCWWSDRYPEPRALLECEGRAYMCLFSVDKKAAMAMCSAIRFTHIGRVTFAALSLSLLPPLRLHTNLKAKLKFLMMVLPQSVVLPECEAVDVLQPGDAELVTAHWDHSDEESYVQKRIELGSSACVRGPEGEPLSWGLTHSEGAIGVVHTMVASRRCGMGTRVVTALARLIRERGLVPFCYVGEKNEGSRRMFERLGFEPAGAVFWVLCDGIPEPSDDSED
eukprot:TRINITY_DN48869_c0_g1_i1.p1 TRINITY_DN48869_c0_g1~~TRINITY_DN48869_c0_g1_i1.p1  ORF type:complete len:225 (+),score=27.26 TRINITY_DN48869_c0_g1_i1:248-922(+)